jgi:hypothetical protein
VRASSILRKRTDGLLGSQGWEKVGFQGADSTPPGFAYADESCAAVTINARMPANRAGHTAVATGSQALVCGGYTLKTPARTTFAGDGNDIECWWFTPTPQPRFDLFKWQPGTHHKPETRWGHAMAQHSVTGALILFGGMRNTSASADPLASPVLQDCWFLDLSNNGSKTVRLVAEYQWKSCDPSSPTALRPMPRYGSVAIFHAGTSSVYISGGFAWTGTTFVAMSDLWALLHYAHDPVWTQINPISETPVGRGFHAAWLFGNSLYIHGGQGPQGVGLASVQSDTWLFDVFTMVWKQLGSSAAAPVASFLSVTVLSETGNAVAVGGLGADNRPISTFVGFDARSGWTEGVPAGSRPPRSAGHSAVYDPESYQMLVSFGITTGPRMMDDQWILDLTTSKWLCSQGSSTQCKKDQSIRGVVATGSWGMGPRPRAFAATVRVGLYKIIFGGLIESEIKCSGGLTRTIHVGSDEMWAMSVASRTWFKVNLRASTSSNIPAKRAFTQLAALKNLGGWSNPLILMGGGSVACTQEDPPCEVPQPLNDIWFTDATPAPTSGTDKMLALDGIDDVVAITLPSWTAAPSMMGILWLDMWLQLQKKGDQKAILFDAYGGLTPALRWYLQGEGTELFAVLVKSPGKKQIQVKKWGPIPGTLVDTMLRLISCSRAPTFPRRHSMRVLTSF